MARNLVPLDSTSESVRRDSLFVSHVVKGLITTKSPFLDEYLDFLTLDDLRSAVVTLATLLVQAEADTTNPGVVE